MAKASFIGRDYRTTNLVALDREHVHAGIFRVTLGAGAQELGDLEKQGGLTEKHEVRR